MKLGTIILYLALFCALQVNSSIESVRHYVLNDGRELVLVTDDYKKGSVRWNELQVRALIEALKDFAKKRPQRKVHVSFEAPTIYDSGENLKVDLPRIKSKMATHKEANDCPAILVPVPAIDGRAVEIFRESEGLSTLIDRDLVLGLAQVPKTEWPENLTLASNDPARGHYLSLIQQKHWLLKMGRFHSLRSLLLPSPIFSKKRLGFQCGKGVAETAANVLREQIGLQKENEEMQVNGFLSFASERLNRDITDEHIGENIITCTTGGISLELVYEYLKEEWDKENPYENGALLDILFTFFHADAPDSMLVILGSARSAVLHKLLERMGVISHVQDIELTTFIRSSVAVDDAN